MAMSKYENIIWQETIKEQIMCHARILYTRELTPNSILYVLNSTSKLPGYASVTYTSHVVAIPQPTNTSWRVLLSSQDCMSLEECLEETLQTLQDRLGSRLQPDVRPADKETNNSAGRPIKQEPVDGSTDRTEEQRLESERPETSFERAFRLQQAKEESARKRMRY